MLLIKDNYRDIQRYYESTWVKFREEGDKLYFIQKVDEDSIVGIDEDGNEFVFTLDNTAPYTLDYILPSKACFQFKSRVLVLSRIPAKQYQRGLSASNTQVVDLTGRNQPLSFTILKEFVNKQQYLTLDAALFDRKRRHSAALSSRFSLLCENNALFLDTIRIGYVFVKEKRVMAPKIFWPEIRDLMNMSPLSKEMELVQ
jgi:hypothetical protein